MPRETKAERIVRESLEKDERMNTYAKAYPDRLMTLLERATNLCWQITVEQHEIVVTDNYNFL